MMRVFQQKSMMILLVILLAAAGWKALLLAMDVFPFNSDEAVVALMARHILQGERPIFFYGQAYMGSLDAFLVSFGFAIFGQKVWIIRLVQTVLYLGTIITTVLIARGLFRSKQVGWLAAVLMVIPTVNVTLYTTVSLGGYGEALLIGNLLLLVSIALVTRLEALRTTAEEVSSLSHPFAPLGGWIFGFGVLVGFGLWANGLTLVFAVPAGLYWLWGLWQARRRLPGMVLLGLLAAGAVGFLAGSAPWWMHALQVGWDALLLELTGSAVAVEQGSWMMRTLSHLFNFFVLGLTAALGLRPPWEVRWLALPLLPFALAFWMAAVGFFIRQAIRPNPYRSAYRMLGGIVLAVTAGFVLTSFGVDPSGRYFLPLTVPLALAAAHMIHSKIRSIGWQAAVVGVVLAFNLWGTLQVALHYPPGITTQFDLQTAVDHRYDDELMQFLYDQDERVGYSSYWVTYPLAFLSSEQLIYAPRLPYHSDLRYTPRDDRYPAYTQTVTESEKAAYIAARNPALEDHLRIEFERLEISWTEKRIGDYHVFYRLSRKVQPDEIGFGKATP
jgi:4-amino-4-deoxy-L-arabinose transferase-like glycosyltransferase